MVSIEDLRKRLSRLESKEEIEDIGKERRRKAREEKSRKKKEKKDLKRKIRKIKFKKVSKIARFAGRGAVIAGKGVKRVAENIEASERARAKSTKRRKPSRKTTTRREIPIWEQF